MPNRSDYAWNLLGEADAESAVFLELVSFAPVWMINVAGVARTFHEDSLKSWPL